jgi:hypothetical protein
MQTPSSLSRAVAGLLLVAFAACDPIGQPSRPAPGPTPPDPPSSDLSGTYTLTLSASSGCRSELPEHMRTRAYAATIHQGGRSLTVKLTSIFPPWDNITFGTENRFIGVLGANDDVVFQLQFEEWFVGERGDVFRAYGRMTATINASGLSGSWDGYMSWISSENGSVTCTAPDHGVVFSRFAQ